MGTVRELFAYDGGRQVSVFVPDAEPVGIVHAGDGALLAGWGPALAPRAPRRCCARESTAAGSGPPGSRR